MDRAPVGHGRRPALGEVEYRQIEDLASGFDISADQLRAARANLGIETRKVGFGAETMNYWTPPSRCPRGRGAS